MNVSKAVVPAPYEEWENIHFSQPLPEPQDPPNFGPVSRFGDLQELRNLAREERRAQLAAAEAHLAYVLRLYGYGPRR